MLALYDEDEEEDDDDDDDDDATIVPVVRLTILPILPCCRPSYCTFTVGQVKPQWHIILCVDASHVDVAWRGGESGLAQVLPSCKDIQHLALRFAQPPRTLHQHPSKTSIVVVR